MKTFRTLLIVLLPLLPLVGAAQVPPVTEKFTSLDTLRSRSLYADLSLLLMAADKELSPHTDFRMMDGAHLRYVLGRSDVDLLFTQEIERDSKGDVSYNNYLALSGGIVKYDRAGDGLVTFRHLYPEVIFIYQSNTYRGLAGRFQAGVMLYPWTLHLSGFKLNVAVGGVYDRSKWKVNEEDRIAECSPELQEKIRFINSRTPLRGGMYQMSREFRPVVVLDARWHPTDALRLRMSTSYQQSLVSPYGREIIDVYPELGKVYPYILSRLEVSTKINRYLSLQTALTVDYENNNLALYDSSWQYSLLCGVTFHLHGRKL